MEYLASTFKPIGDSGERSDGNPVPTDGRDRERKPLDHCKLNVMSCTLRRLSDHFVRMFEIPGGYSCFAIWFLVFGELST